MVCENQDRFVNRLRVGKDRHRHNARPRTVLINLMCSCRNSNTNDFNFINEVMAFLPYFHRTVNGLNINVCQK